MAETNNAIGRTSSAAGDGLGIALSSLCVLHCLALPFSAVAMPVIDHAFSTHGSVHAVFLVGAIVFGLWALAFGWRQHRRFVPLVYGLSGIAMLSAGLAVHPDAMLELFFSLAGSALLLIGHGLNWRFRQQTLLTAAS